jgi:microcystin-dependent protein
MGTISFVVPVAGTDLNSVADPEISTALTTILTWANGNIDASNVSSSFLTQLAVPIGGITQYAGSTDPTPTSSTWLICDGRAINRTTYSALFGIVSTTYGSGDGSTTFNIPDLRGRVAVGADSGGVHLPVNHPALGATTGGEEQHALSTAELASHSHNFGSNFNTVPAAQNANFNYSSYPISPGGSTVVATANGTGGGWIGLTGTDSTGSGTAHNNLQPYLAVNHIVRVL